MLKRSKKEMNSQNKNTTAYSPNPLSNIEFSEALDASRSENNLTKIALTDDDLIASLQNRRENRRARQVIEWEIRRRETPQSVLRGAA
jgi:hypothetical protein